MKFFSVSIAIICFCLFSPPSQAAFSPVSVGIFPPVQFPASDFTISGFRLSLLWGKQRDIYGLDIGAIGNITEQEFVGTSISGIFNSTNGSTTVLGVQLAGITNVNTNKTDVFGIQIAGIVNSNKAVSKIAGLQVSIANLSPHTDIYGLQVGIYNTALNVNGLQVGIVNVTDSLHGLQIGLLNFHRKGFFTVSPIINIGF